MPCPCCCHITGFKQGFLDNRRSEVKFRASCRGSNVLLMESGFIIAQLFSGIKCNMRVSALVGFGMSGIRISENGNYGCDGYRVLRMYAIVSEARIW